jgi:hypothetical protein
MNDKVLENGFSAASAGMDVRRVASDFLTEEFAFRSIGAPNHVAELGLQLLGACKIESDATGTVTIRTPADEGNAQMLSSALQRTLIFVAGFPENIGSRWASSDILHDITISARLAEGKDPFKRDVLAEITNPGKRVIGDQVQFSITRQQIEELVSTNPNKPIQNPIIQKLWDASNKGLVRSGTLDFVIP